MFKSFHNHNVLDSEKNTIFHWNFCWSLVWLWFGRFILTYTNFVAEITAITCYDSHGYNSWHLHHCRDWFFIFTRWCWRVFPSIHDSLGGCKAAIPKHVDWLSHFCRAHDRVQHNRQACRHTDKPRNVKTQCRLIIMLERRKNTIKQEIEVIR